MDSGPPAAWWQATFDLPVALEESTAQLLEASGALGAEVRPRGDAVQVVAYFPASAEPGAVAAALRAAGQEAGLRLEPAVAPFADGRWEEEYQRSLRPFPVGRRLLIVPGHADVPAGAGRIPLYIPPGRAFGTGDHATTALCLEFLEAAVTPGAHLLDVGTGSGILAIAALRLGAGRAVAVEPDREAAAVARRNFRRNGVSARAELVAGTTADVAAGWFDLLTANLFAGLLRDLMPEFSCLLRPGGRGVLSGLRAEEAGALLDAAAARGLAAVDLREDDGWAALELRKPPRHP